MKRLFTPKPKFLPILIGLTFFCLTNLIGQGLYDLTSFYRHNWQFLNPASVDYIFIEGQKQQYFFNASVRQQWRKIGNNDFPKVMNGNFEIHDESLGIKYGAFVHSYQAGVIQHHRIQGNFAYKIFLNSRDRYISVGLNAGVGNFNIRLGDIRWVDERGKENLENYSNFYPDISLGVFYADYPRSFNYRSENGIKKYYAGVSVPKIFVDPLYTQFNSTFEDLAHKRIFPVYIIAGLDYQVVENVRLEPSIWARWALNNPNNSLGGFHSIDVMITATFFNQFWGKVGYDTSNSVHGALGSFIPLEVGANSIVLKIGVGVDFGIGNIGGFGPAFEGMFGGAW